MSRTSRDSYYIQLPASRLAQSNKVAHAANFARYFNLFRREHLDAPLPDRFAGRHAVRYYVSSSEPPQSLSGITSLATWMPRNV
jgi:hypothetical protein